MSQRPKALITGQGAPDTRRAKAPPMRRECGLVSAGGSPTRGAWSCRALEMWSLVRKAPVGYWVLERVRGRRVEGGTAHRCTVPRPVTQCCNIALAGSWLGLEGEFCSRCDEGVAVEDGRGRQVAGRRCGVGADDGQRWWGNVLCRDSQSAWTLVRPSWYTSCMRKRPCIWSRQAARKRSRKRVS